jgi:hypothetical protein
MELQLASGVQDQRGPWALASRLTAAGGLAYNRNGLAAALGRAGAESFYGRFTVTGTARRSLGRNGPWSLAGRLYAGVTTGDRAVVRQRQLYLAGADPLAQFSNPFLRSRGALLIRPDFYYHAPGGAGLRGFDPRLSAAGIVALTGELERTIRRKPQGKLFRRIGLAAFGDAGHAFNDQRLYPGGGQLEFLADLGVGIRAEHRIGQTTFTTRADFPLFVSRPALAQDTGPGRGEKAGFRWVVSFEPAL